MCQSVLGKLSQFDLASQVEQRFSIADKIMQKQGFVGATNPADELKHAIAGTESRNTIAARKAGEKATRDNQERFSGPAAHTLNISARKAAKQRGQQPTSI